MHLLIVGINGQDGQLLAKNLVKEGHQVVGIGRQQYPTASVAPILNTYLSIEVGKLSGEYLHALNSLKPDVVFYLAAVHGSAGTQLESKWELLQSTSILGLHQTLEFARQNANTQVVNFSSARVFGRFIGPTLTEHSAKLPSDLYGIIKNNADQIVEFYNKSHKVKATSLILFNHESNLRGPTFFSKKLVDDIYRLKSGRTAQHNYLSFDFWNDWGLAEEYMEILSKCFSSLDRSRYILSSGHTMHTFQLITEIFDELGLDQQQILNRSLDERKVGEVDDQPPWTATNAAFFKDTGYAPKIVGKSVFLNLLYEKLDES